MEDLDKLKADWKQAQLFLREHLLVTDTEEWQIVENFQGRRKLSCDLTEESRYGVFNITDGGATFPGLKYAAGVDVSFSITGDQGNVAIVIVQVGELCPVYSSCRPVTVTQPYVPGFLAFREVDFVVESMRILKESHPELYPQVVLVDGNGILHPERFGMACHLGVLLDVPCIGVGKNLYCVDGLARDDNHKLQIAALRDKGDFFYLYGEDSEEILGAALKSSKNSFKPMYVSVGHRCSLRTALQVVNVCSKFRVPEPIRLADIYSRENLRKSQGSR